jgi:hypothetical protein
MKRLLPAYLLLALAAGACDDPSGSGARVDRVIVTPAERNLNAGDSVKLSAVARDEASELVTGVDFDWASLDPEVASVSDAGLVKGLRTGTARIVVSARDRADTASITVFGTAAECEPPAAGLSLGVGESVQRRGSAGSVLCLDGGASGAEYTVIPFNGDRPAAFTSGPSASLRVTAAGLTTVFGPPNPSLSPFPVAGGLASASMNARDGGFHIRLNERARAPLARLVPAARAAERARRGGARMQMQQVAPPLGMEMRFNAATSGGFCEATDYRTGRVVAVSQRAVVVADTANPAGGLTAADYQHVAATYDSLVHPVNAAAFGEPADIDGNGRVIIFYTRAVNELTPANVDYVVGGYFYGRDLFPRENDPEFGGACPASNNAEMFYMLAADPTGVVNGNARSTAEVVSSTVGVVGHELQHLISASRRLYIVPGVVDLNWNEEIYLNEGLSHIAEELLFYHRAQSAPRMNLGNQILAAGSRELAALAEFQQQNFLRYGEFVKSPETRTPYNDADDLGDRGAAWAFLRYLADRRNGSDQALWQALVNNERTGLDNLEEVLGQDPIPLYRDFAVSVYTDDAVAGVPPIFTQPSWNHRALFQTIQNGIPLKVRPLTSGSPENLALRPGGASYLRAGVAPNQRASVLLTAEGGSLEDVWVTVVRTR